MLLYTRLNIKIKYEFKLNNKLAIVLSAILGITTVCLYTPLSPRPTLETLVIISALTTLLNISIIDLEQFVIPDTYNIILVGLGLLNITFIKTHYLFLIIAVMSFIIFLIVYLISGALGMGDVKLSFALGLFMDITLFKNFVMYSFGLGAIIAILMLITKFKSSKDKLAFGPLMAAGFALTMLLQ